MGLPTILNPRTYNGIYRLQHIYRHGSIGLQSQVLNPLDIQ